MRRCVFIQKTFCCRTNNLLLHAFPLLRRVNRLCREIARRAKSEVFAQKSGAVSIAGTGDQNRAHWLTASVSVAAFCQYTGTGSSVCVLGWFLQKSGQVDFAGRGQKEQRLALLYQSVHERLVFLFDTSQRPKRKRKGKLNVMALPRCFGLFASAWSEWPVTKRNFAKTN